MGYKNDTINIGDTRSDKFVGILFLQQDKNMLEDVTVTSSSRQTTIDKDIQVVTKQMRLGASDTKDLLSKVSGVSYDRYNNSIKVDNSSNIIILANGVEKNQTYIQNLDPERIDKIEIVRDPGGRYGLEGYTAIVNVILKRNYVGSEFFITDQALIDIGGEYFVPQNSLDVSYNYTRNDLNIYASVNNRIDNFLLNSDTKTMYKNDSTVYENPISGKNLDVNNNSINYTVGTDYYINPKHIISFESNFSNFPKSTNKVNQEFATSIEQSGIEIEKYNFFAGADKETTRSNSSVFYVGKLSNKDRIDASVSFFTFNESFNNNYIQEGGLLPYTRTENGLNSYNITRMNLEYSRDYDSALSTQIGYGNYFKNTTNDFTLNNDTSTNDEYKQSNQRHKFYAYASYIFNESLSMKIGAAGETNHIVDDDQDNNYFIFQPLLDFKYSVNSNLSFKLKYRASSSYPSIDQTNPFVNRIDPRTISIGNPNLAPSVTHRASLRADILQGLISVEPYFEFSDNYIGQTGKLRPDGIFEFTYDNIGHYQEKGIKTNFTIPFGEKLIWENSIRFYNSSIEHDGTTNNISDWTANSQLVFLGLKNDGVIVVNYERAMNKQISSLGYSREENDYWLLLVQQPFFNKRLTVLLGYFLPLDIGADYIQDTYTNTSGYEQYKNVDISILKNLVLLKLTYRLNKGKIKKTEKYIEEEDTNSKGGFL